MKFSTIFSVYDPSKKAHPHHEIRAFLDAERHEFWERQDSSALWARETPKISPRKTRISRMPGFFGTLGQRNAKNQPQKDTNFGNTIILQHFGPEIRQNQPKNTRISAMP